MDNLEWGIVPLEEQETIINIDYLEKTIKIYTTRKSVAKRLKRRLGEADEIFKISGKLVGVTYKRKLNDKNIRPILSVSTIIGGFRTSKDKEE